MPKLPLNERTVTVTMKRIELCDLLIACTNLAYLMNQTGNSSAKWNKLHNILAEALKEFDKEQGCSWA